MKIFKGCLIAFLLFCALTFLFGYIYKLKLTKNCIEDHKKIENSFTNLKNKLEERNKTILASDFSDSIKILAEKSNLILSKNTDFNKVLWTEFNLNEKTYENASLKNINNELNFLKNNYNSDLRSFFGSWTIFPMNLIKMEQKFKKYNYLEIDYGENNQANMKRRKEVEHWIETGEWK